MGFDSWFWSRREGGIRVDRRIVWLQRQPMLLKFTVRLFVSGVLLVLQADNTPTRLLKRTSAGRDQAMFEHNHTRVWMLALGGDSVD